MKHIQHFVGVSLLPQSKAFELYSGSFGDVSKLWKLNFNLWLIFTHHTWERNTNEHEHSCNKRKNISIFKTASQAKVRTKSRNFPPRTRLFTTSWNILQHWGNASTAVTEHTYNNTILYQWTFNTPGSVGENTSWIHGRLELSHLDEFHLVAMITAMNQKNRTIKSPWVLLLCLQSIPFSVSEAGLLDYNIAAVHAKIPDKGAGRSVCAMVMWLRVIHKSRLERQTLWHSTHACSFLYLKWQEGTILYYRHQVGYRGSCRLSVCVCVNNKSHKVLNGF